MHDAGDPDRRGYGTALFLPFPGDGEQEERESGQRRHAGTLISGGETVHLPRFDYLEPDTLEEALLLLTSHPDTGRVIAGGTDLLIAMKQRLQTPEYLIGLDRITTLKGVRQQDNMITIGPLTTLEEVIGSPPIREKFPEIIRAAWEVGSPLLRSTATIGGNLCLDSRCRFYNQSLFWRSTRGPCCKTGGTRCHVTGRENMCFSSFSGDLAPVLIALNATVTLAGGRGERVIPLSSFYTGDGRRPNLVMQEKTVILTGIGLPVPDGLKQGAYRKYRLRPSVDFPLVGVAATLTRDRREKGCLDVRIVLTGVGPRPVEALRAREKLLGEELRPDVVAQAAETAAAEIRPAAVDQVTPYYKRKLVRCMVAETLSELGGLSG